MSIAPRCCGACANRSLLALLLVAVIVCPGFAQAERVAVTFSGRTLGAILQEYEALGLRFIYSSDLVQSDTVIREEPPGGEPIERLQFALRRLSLETRQLADGPILLVPPDKNKTTIEGTVRDANTGRPLSGVRVELAGQSAFTNDEGIFSIQAGAERTLEPFALSRSGYEDQLIKPMAPQEVDQRLNVALQPRLRVEEVVVNASRYALKGEKRASKTVLTTADINTVPELGDDTIRAANYLPGTAGVGLSARPHIRGGLQDETLVIFNNVELLEPFHLKDFQSLFSTFNPSVVKTVDIHTGGFPARYGDRMSGVMDIDAMDGQPDFGSEVTLSLLTSAVATYGKLPNGTGEWALSLRRGNLDFVFNNLEKDYGTPRYSDAFGQVSLNLSGLDRLDIGFLTYHDDVVLLGDDTDRASSRYGNTYGWVQLHRTLATGDSLTVVSQGRVDNRRRGSVNDTDAGDSVGQVVDKRNFDLWSLSHRQTYTTATGTELEIGGRLNYQRGNYEYQSNTERGELADFLGIVRTESRFLSASPEGMSGGAYLSARWQLYENFTAETGLRWDFQDYAHDFERQVSPRFSLLHEISDTSQLRYSVGRFYQPEAIHELQISDGHTRFQSPQYADHLIASWDQALPSWHMQLRTEIFAKNFKQVKRRHENLFNPLLLLPETGVDRIAIAPSEARARGFEISLRWQPDGNQNAWLSYTRSRVEDRIDHTWQTRRWDQAHTVSAGGFYRTGPWSASVALNWHSGWRTTSLPGFLNSGQTVDYQRNDTELPNFYAVNIRLAREWLWPDQSVEVYFEVSNVFDRQNSSAVEYDLKAEAGGFSTTRNNESLLEILPSIGVHWQFE